MNNSTIPLPTAAQQAAAAETTNMTLIVVAVVMGLVAAGINFWYIKRVENQITADSVTVWKLSHNIKPGERLKVSKDLIEARMPKQFAEGLVDIVTTEKARDRYDGKDPFVRSANQGEWLAPSMFTSNTEPIESKIGEGRRACPLPINGRNASGILRPGMYVDLLGDFTPPGSKTARSMTVIQNVKVLAVGANIDDSGKTSRTGFTNISVDVELAVAEQLITISRIIGRDGYDVLPRGPGSEAKDKFPNVNKEVLKLVGLDQ